MSREMGFIGAKYPFGDVGKTSLQPDFLRVVFRNGLFWLAKQALLQSEMVHIMVRNGLFRMPKWALSQTRLRDMIFRFCVNS